MFFPDRVFFPGMLSLVLLMSAGCASISSGDLANIFDAARPLDEETVADGLREALSVGTGRTVDQVSAVGGFADNADLRIPIPERVEPVAERLRAIGLGDQVDDFELTMNRAAERAAGEALDVFVGVIRSLTIQDAFDVLNGPPDAATELFRARASDELRTRFAPVIRDAMSEVGLYMTYTRLVDRYNSVPFVEPIQFDLETYILDETMGGLFYVLEQEEARIRRDPAARTTALLRRVFGSLDN